MIAKKLADFVQRMYPTGKRGIVISDEDVDAKLPQEFEMVRISTEREMATGFWTMTQAGEIPKLDSALLQKAIDAKNPRVSDYRKQVQRVWLLLVIDPLYLSSSFSVPDEVLTQQYRSDFDRTFLFSAREDRSWPLVTQRN